MAKSFKRLMSLALVLAMLFTMLPATLAEETASAEVPAVEEIVEVIEETPAEEESAEEEAPVEETTEEETPVEETPVEETTEEETPVEETTEEETTEEETPVEETTEEETTEEETPVEETTEEETTEEETTEEETTEEETTEEETTEEETTEEETTEEETAEEETSEEEEPIYEEDPAAMLGVAVSEGGTVVLEQKDSFVVTGNDILSDQIDAPRWYPVTYYVQYRIKGETSAFIKKKLDDSITLEHGTTYEVQEGYLGAGEKWSDSYYIDFNVYHEVTASLADASDTNATGASVSIDRTKVYHGESVTVTAVRVEGYKAVLMFNDVEIHTFNSDDTEWSIAHKVTASGTYTVQYVSIEEKQYAVNLSVENSDYGSASLGKTEGSEGDEILLTVTVNDTGADNSKYVYKVEVSGESAFYDSETSKVKIGTEDVVVTVSFSKKELKGNASASVNFNGFYADATALGSNDLAALKEDIFNAIVTNDADEVEVGNVEIQYYPFYENKFLGSVTESGYSDAEKLKALNATTDDSLLAGTGIEYYAFGERGIGAKEKVRITWDGLFIDAYVTLVESRDPHPYTTGTPETVTLTGNTETDKDAIVASAEKSISGTVEGAIISYTVGDYTVPAAGENGEATVNVVIQENENYLESAFEISVPITTEVSPAVITVTQNNNGVVEVPETAYASNGAVTVKVTPNSGYYVESVTVNDTSVTGTYSRVDVDESYIDNDYRNIFTGSFEIVDGETYEVEVTYGKITVSVSELTISVNGFSDETAQADFSEKLAVSAIGAAATDANGNNVAGELKVQLNGALDWKDADSLKGLLSNYLDVPANRDMRVVFTPEDTNKYPEVVSETVKLTIVESRPQTKISVKEEVTLKVEDASQITWDAVFEEMGGVEAYTLNADDKKDQPIDWSNVTYAPAELNTTCPENGKSVEYTHKFELAETAEYLGTSAEAVITIANPEYYANLTVEPGNSTVTIYNEAGETVNEFTQMAGGTYTAEVAVTEGEYSLVSVKFNDVDLNAINGVYEFALESGETAVNEYKLIVTTEPVNYNVTWIVDGSSYDTGSVGFGTEITPPATPTKDGYTFGGWDKEIPETMPAENITFTAKDWVANTDTAYTVEIYTMDVYGNYGEAVKENLTGTTDTEAVYIPAQKEGFTVADKISGNIAGDGSLVLKVY
ncbi:MAG: InlB B-repeat-containing protein, partial [Clostridia bacterium]|nr:InlB B-repeat-containing protein [Clostridia bacterium]